jgi:5-methylcytosine-specific restriction endonuclease McrA
VSRKEQRKRWRKTEAGRAARRRQRARQRAKRTPFKLVDGKKQCRQCKRLDGEVSFHPSRWTCLGCLAPIRKAEKAAYKSTPAAKIQRRLAKRLRRAESVSVGMAVARHCEGLLGLQKWRCAVCRADLKLGKHLDHVIPLAAGGRHEVGNFQWLCPDCNLAKSAKHPVEFMQSRGFLL